MSTLHLLIAGDVAELRLDNPARGNAFTVHMLRELDQHCAVIDGNADVACVIVTAAGEKAFCTGADINAWGDVPPA
ncbi:MAG: enoyl-CoA hydratase/isomerase family protein, partial [Paracoccaceae bacterium]